ncbi:MAG TPA: hypothetical protein ENJ82_07170 [Bacteroidetes bacterium]|nr:hypothetical protein [Bacteroidota bacterium]
MRINFQYITHHLLLLLLLGMLLTPQQSKAQWLEPHRVQIGVSGGFGGLHGWGAPSFDVIWNRFTARVSPGLYYLGGGITYQLAFYKPKVRKDRILILSAYYLNDWLLTNRKATEFRKDQHIYMLMPGIHVNLNHRGTVYFEVSAGGLYLHERIFNADRSIHAGRDYFSPMGEIRIGGIFLSRKEHVQQFPHYFKEKPADRIQKRKLKFKKR